MPRAGSIEGVTARAVIVVAFLCTTSPTFAQFTPSGQVSDSAQSVVRDILSRCLDTYQQRMCATCWRSSTADKDVCWVDNNGLFDDERDLGGRITDDDMTRNGRYFAVHSVLNAILRRDSRRGRDEWQCMIDYHTEPNERDTFRRHHDQGLYESDPNLEGIDWCYVRELGYTRTFTLPQIAWQVLNSLPEQQTAILPEQQPGIGGGLSLCKARAEGSNGAWGEGEDINRARARYIAMGFCRQAAPDCRIVRERCP